MEQSWFHKFMSAESLLAQQAIQAIQAQFNQRFNLPLFKTVYHHDIIFTCQNSTKDSCGFMIWFRKEDSKRQPNLFKLLVDLSQHDGNCQLTPTQNGQSPEGSQKELNHATPTQTEEQGQKLYSENEIGLLKKQLQFDSKGLLSKSTDTDHQRNLITTIRFKCKNYPYANICPFLHILQYKCTVNGKPLYTHKPINSEHMSECIMDQQNIQYNVTARKIDSSMNILEKIVAEDPTIKPKTILQRFGERLGEQSEQFLYEGLTEKNIKRSIKKYFDNAVAKAKNKVRQR